MHVGISSIVLCFETMLETKEHAITMLDLFAPIKCLLQEETVRVDNVVFRLHSRVTVLLLLVCTILVTAKQYIGEPISCMTDASIGTNSANL